MSLLLKTSFWASVLAVVVLSLLPVAYLPPQSFDVWDKAQHTFGFMILAVLGQLAYPTRSRGLLGLWLLVLGGGIELAQSATGWRYGDLLDWIADGVGIALGLAGGWLVCWTRAHAPRSLRRPG